MTDNGDITAVAASDGCLYGLDIHTGNNLIVTDFGGNVYLFTGKGL